MSDETLLDLAAKCEAAKGPDRELDLRIAKARDGVPAAATFVPGGSDKAWLNDGPGMTVLKYTSSLDAAMTLVPEGCGWLVGYGRTRPDEPMGGAAITQKAATENISEANDVITEAEAATPALALCAASLRALADRLAKLRDAQGGQP